MKGFMPIQCHMFDNMISSSKNRNIRPYPKHKQSLSLCPGHDLGNKTEIVFGVVRDRTGANSIPEAYEIVEALNFEIMDIPFQLRA